MIRLDIAESFGERLRTLEDFMTAQDEQSAPARIEDLREEVLSFIDLVKLHREIGRPASALAAGSVEGKRRLERVLQLAVEAGLPVSLPTKNGSLTECVKLTQGGRKDG